MMGRSWWPLSLLLLTAVARAADPFIAVIGIIGDRVILKVDGQQHMLRPGQTEDGVTLVSADSHGAVVAVNGHQRSIALGMDSGPIVPRVEHSIDIPLNDHGQYMVGGFINGQPTDMLVDTGANIVSMTAAQADRLGLNYRGGPRMEVANAGAGIVQAWVVTLDTVRVGPIVAHGVQAAVRDVGDQTPVLLGMTFLKEVTVIKQGDSMRLTGQ